MSSQKSINRRAQRRPVFFEPEDEYRLQVSREWDTSVPGRHTTIESTVSMNISKPTSSRNIRTASIHPESLLKRFMKRLTKRPWKRPTEIPGPAERQRSTKRTLGPNPTLPRQHVILHDDVLLNIFGCYQNSSPFHWHRLAHVCRKWRCVVFASPLTLNLRLFCSYGRPFMKSLDCWPAFPIVVQYGGSPTLGTPTPEDEDDIAAALSYCDRVSSISLTVTRSLLEKMNAIEGPFSELEELVLLSRNTGELALPSGIKWGSRLRSLHWTRITCPAVPQLLSSSQNLVDLRLHEIPRDSYFSPNELANALSGMSQLQSLSLHFLSSLDASRRNHLRLPSLSGRRVVLPALTYLNYRGISTYLDSFADRVDAPRLRNLEVTFFHQLTLDVSRIGRLVDHIGLHNSHHKADVLISQQAITITFTETQTFARIKLQISCEQFDWKLSSMARLCPYFSNFTFGVRDLYIKTTQSSGLDVDGEQWLELIRVFSGAERVHLLTDLATDILLALKLDRELASAVLYSLKHLYVQMPLLHSGPLRSAVSSFSSSRRRSGRPVVVEYIEQLKGQVLDQRHRTDRPPTRPRIKHDVSEGLPPRPSPRFTRYPRVMT